jgi:thiamine biosynthesis lipoprotein
VIHHAEVDKAHAALRDTLGELARLEAMFSLFRADSWLSRINATGRVRGAPAEFTALLSAALAMAESSLGVFDPTVQPLWQLYFDHFVVRGSTELPPAGVLTETLALVNWRRVQVTPTPVGATVTLPRAGMGLTLNGIAQGFITDRCCDVLRAHGLNHTLVDMGEPRAVAAKPDGSAWRIGLADPRDPARALHTLSVIDQAVATSGGYGTRLDTAGRYTHLLDPRTGRTAPAAESVTVIAPTAALADGLSTALAVLPAADTAARRALLGRHPGCRAICIDADGRVAELEPA